MARGYLGFLVLLSSSLGTCSQDADEPCQVIFVNTGDKNIRVSWVGRDGGVSRIADVSPGHEHSEESFCGHSFMLANPGVPPRLVMAKSSGKVFMKATDKEVTVENAGALVGHEQKHKGPEWEALAEKLREQCQHTFTGYPKESSYFCSPKFDHRLFLEARQDYSDQVWQRKMSEADKNRVHNNRKQPAQFFNFTPVGFEVRGRGLPEELLAEIRAFYRQGRLTQARPENNPVFDPNLSGRESDTWLLTLPEKLKEKLRHVLRGTLAKWSNLPEEDLKSTAIYGLRFYHNGSKLNMHVDRRETHVLSAIIEVDHLGVDDGTEPESQDALERWPLHILDHSGQEHKVPNRAGQVILYESATCVHGRPDVFRGREFVNIFVHFAPKTWPSAYTVKTTSHPFLLWPNFMGSLLRGHRQEA